MDEPPPCRPLGQLLPVGIDGIPVELAAVGIDIDLVKTEPASLLPEEATNPKHEHHGNGETLEEETFGACGTPSRRDQ